MFEKASPWDTLMQSRVLNSNSSKKNEDAARRVAYHSTSSQSHIPKADKLKTLTLLAT
jgi:hypothetical protein